MEFSEKQIEAAVKKGVNRLEHYEAAFRNLDMPIQFPPRPYDAHREEEAEWGE